MPFVKSDVDWIRAVTGRKNSEMDIDLLPDSPEKHFVADFLEACVNFDVFPLPQVHILGSNSKSLRTQSANGCSDITTALINADRRFQSLKGDTNEFEIAKFSVTFESSEKIDAPTKLYCKGYELTLCLLDALKKTTKKYTTLTTLKLQRCSIDAFGVMQISRILTDIKCLRDLNLDMNPNIEQNFHLFCVSGTGLLYLSLKLCAITDDGSAGISSQLQYSDETVMPRMVTLNLANNNISDIGAEHFGSMLRTNRSIQSLTLSANSITDTGALSILKQLSMFTLSHSEVVEKRRRNVRNLMILNQRINDKINDGKNETPEHEAGQRRTRTAKKTSGSTRRTSFTRDALDSAQSTANGRTTKDDEESDIFTNSHPLFDDLIAIDGDLKCRGNLKLQHLDLSFNQLTEVALGYTADYLQRQRDMVMNDVRRGLLYVNLEGNKFDECHELAMQLKRMNWLRGNLARPMDLTNDVRKRQKGKQLATARTFIRSKSSIRGSNHHLHVQ